MAAPFGIELHRTPTHPDGPRFVRMVPAGPDLYTRTGMLGHRGTLEITHHDSPRSAERTVNEQVSHLELTETFITAYFTTMPLSPTWFDHPGRDPERYFLEAWSASVLDRVTDGHPFETRTTWASFTGLATHRHYDHGAAVLYEYLVALPHVVAPGEDRLVAQTVGLPYLAADVGLLAPFANTTRDSRGRRMRASKIAPIRPNCPHSTPSCQDCAIRIAQLLAYLTRGINIATLSDDHRTLLSDTAHRMLRLGLDPAIPAGDQVSLPTHATR